MSICPEKDLHSIYLDGEMPKKFMEQYEAHLASCQNCKKELEKLREISNAFREDSISVNLDSVYLEQSFERLQTKLRFSKNTAQANEKNIYRPYKKWIVSFASAAAIFAVIFAPIELKTKNSGVQELKTIARTNIRPMAENKLVIDGNIDTSKISSVLSTKSQKTTQALAKEDNEAEYNPSFINKNQKVVSATSLASNFSDIDVFRPDFNNPPVSVRIEVPYMYTLPLQQANKIESR
ncbi:anti-sigma factor family protein [Treponema pectinovorum]|uniref:anti-sigma factor family protein n=1 Tax=Treponema pectinovorum TaxID=164 RepID=UPI0011CA9762|nr:zf-HC2 domain-containing protein [Treponema pectinovorum]